MRVCLQADQFRRTVLVISPGFKKHGWIKEVIALQVVKTVKIPTHYAITKHKLSILDSLTARTTYGVWLWSKLFKEYKLKGSYEDRRLFHDQVRKETKLSGAMAQCCFDTAA